ncbi:O-antigen ligase family protein [Bacillus sp. Cr_A10]|uniref:O-antigen ligase family protein n=1 Tax=Bacillus sp. Cr_A10 TaxID=3033993 RepID=UPI0023DB293F|nr:O-antigen ligase family protein [Bacillus sp. Cr_A10]MDF2065063.1 hypothetical protein [Bacillus sp. Cr_A10]
MSFDLLNDRITVYKGSKSNYAKFQYPVDLTVIGACLLGDKVFHVSVLIYFLGIYCVFRILLSSIDNNFALLISLVPNLGIMFISIAGSLVPILNILICIALIKQIISFIHEPIKKTYLLLIGFFLVYEWFHVIYYNLKSISLLLSWSSAVLYVSLFLLYSRKTYNHQIVIKYFIAGLCISTIYGVLDFYGNYGTLLNDNPTIRFRGGAGDSNYYSMYIMIAMFSMLYIVKKHFNRVTIIIYPMLFVLFTGFGLLSLSRMFLLVVSFLLFLLLVKILFSFQKNKKLFLFLLVVIGILGLLSLNFITEFAAILDLLFSRFTDFIDDPDALTSNRNVIAEQYMKLMTSSIVSFILGIGIQEYHLRSGIFLETHNILLELFVVWGIFGFIVFSSFVLTILCNVGIRKKLSNISIISCLPIICMGASYMSINALSNESFFLLFLFAIKNIYEFN